MLPNQQNLTAEIYKLSKKRVVEECRKGYNQISRRLQEMTQVTLRNKGDVMLPQLIELIAQEHCQTLLQEAAQKRLFKILPPQASITLQGRQWVCDWLGRHMVAWGLKLQGASVVGMPQLSGHKPAHR